MLSIKGSLREALLALRIDVLAAPRSFAHPHLEIEPPLQKNQPEPVNRLNFATAYENLSSLGAAS